MKSLAVPPALLNPFFLQSTGSAATILSHYLFHPASHDMDQVNSPQESGAGVRQSSSWFSKFSFKDVVRKTPFSSTVDAALTHFTTATCAMWQRIKNAYDTAIEMLRNFDAKVFAHAAFELVKKKPKKTAMIVACIVIPILSSALIGPILGVIGFTAAGPAAGKYSCF